MENRSKWFHVVLVPCLVLMYAACHPSPRHLTVVTGKTVYRDMALEGAAIKVETLAPEGDGLYLEAVSGYHGSFRIHLPPGDYRIEARTVIRQGQNQIILSGRTGTINVREGENRIDRVLIRMEPDPPRHSGGRKLMDRFTSRVATVFPPGPKTPPKSLITPVQMKPLHRFALGETHLGFFQ